MYEITITRSFSAAHLLKDIGGKCEGLHGHNFIVEVTLAAPTLSKEGLLGLSHSEGVDRRDPRFSGS
jgi:6-pyruvoyltetrahydropterin/6-carboxytetrahydropterin synthase